MPDTSRGKTLLERLRLMLGGRALHSDHTPTGREEDPVLARLEAMEQQLAHLLRQVQAAGHAQNGRVVDSVNTRLESITHHLEEVSRQVQAVGGRQNGLEDAAVRDSIAALEKQVGRAGREQLKANALAEAQNEKLAAALEMLRADSERRDAELGSLREQVQAAQTAARQEVIQAILPALDGLDEAVRSGQKLMQQPGTPAPSATFLERIWMRKEPPPQDAAALREGMSAWLVGLTFVRQRLLDVLAAEGVQPISAEGQPFDPQMHIAMDVVPASAELAPGTVATELRRGYRIGNRVLRHAEVVVSTESIEQPVAGDRA